MALFKIEDMTCAHCVATIDADLVGKTVDITSSADPVAIQEALIEAGYDARAMAA